MAAQLALIHREHSEAAFLFEQALQAHAELLLPDGDAPQPGWEGALRQRGPAELSEPAAHWAEALLRMGRLEDAEKALDLAGALVQRAPDESAGIQRALVSAGSAELAAAKGAAAASAEERSACARKADELFAQALRCSEAALQASRLEGEADQGVSGACGAEIETHARVLKRHAAHLAAQADAEGGPGTAVGAARAEHEAASRAALRQLELQYGFAAT